jgi:hypothetical protein
VSSSVSAIISQIPSYNRYEKRYELLDLYDLRVNSVGKVNLLNKMLRQCLFQQSGLLCDVVLLKAKCHTIALFMRSI